MPNLMDKAQLAAVLKDIEKQVAQGSRKLTRDEQKLMQKAYLELDASSGYVTPRTVREPAVEPRRVKIVEDTSRPPVFKGPPAPCLRTAKVKEMDLRLARLLGHELLDTDGTPITVSEPSRTTPSSAYARDLANMQVNDPRFNTVLGALQN